MLLPVKNPNPCCPLKSQSTDICLKLFLTVLVYKQCLMWLKWSVHISLLIQVRQIFIGESNIMKKLFYDKYTANCLIQIRNFLLNKILIDGLAWFGLLVDYCDVFISCLDSHSDGIHLLQMIHWWASDVMLNFSKYCIFWCMFIYVLDSLRVNPFSEKIVFLGEPFLYHYQRNHTIAKRL